VLRYTDIASLIFITKRGLYPMDIGKVSGATFGLKIGHAEKRSL
jgi:hypothetical protein